MDYEHISPALLNRLLVLQSFYDRVSTLALECNEKRLPADLFATRVAEMSQQFEKSLKGRHDN